MDRELVTRALANVVGPAATEELAMLGGLVKAAHMAGIKGEGPQDTAQRIALLAALLSEASALAEPGHSNAKTAKQFLAEVAKNVEKFVARLGEEVDLLEFEDEMGEAERLAAAA